jgi:hypothetical protein
VRDPECVLTSRLERATSGATPPRLKVGHSTAVSPLTPLTVERHVIPDPPDPLRAGIARTVSPPPTRGLETVPSSDCDDRIASGPRPVLVA